MGFYGPMSYTTGNWTVTSQQTDTIATAKTLSIPDMSYAANFAVTSDEPGECKLANITGSALLPVENLRYGRTVIANVYANTEVPASSQLEVKTGVRILVESAEQLHAVNSVSGKEVDVPVRAWLCVQVPTAGIVGDKAIEHAVGRCLGAMFSTGTVTTARLEACARGSVNPM